MNGKSYEGVLKFWVGFILTFICIVLILNLLGAHWALICLCSPTLTIVASILIHWFLLGGNKDDDTEEVIK